PGAQHAPGRRRPRCAPRRTSGGSRTACRAGPFCPSVDPPLGAPVAPRGAGARWATGSRGTPGHVPQTPRRYPGLTSPLHTTLSRRTALRGLGVVGLSAAAGLFAASQAHASDDLVVVDQVGTGPWDAENCGPTSAGIAMGAARREVEHCVSGEEGTTVGGNARAVMEMRARCGLSPWDDPAEKTVDYIGAYLGDLETG